MEVQIRPIRAEEFPNFVEVLESSAGRHPTSNALADAVAAYPVDRVLAVVVDGALVGGVGSDLLELTVPGPVAVPATRATLTGVLPTERGRGLAAALLTAQLRDLRRRGEPIVIATTSTPGLLWAVGYAPASRALQIEVDLARVRVDPAAVECLGRSRFCEAGEARMLLPQVFDRHRQLQVGQVLRPEAFWEMWFLDRPLYRIGDGERFVVVHEGPDGRADGYVTYRLTTSDLRLQPVGELVVEDLIAVTETANRALWQYCLAFGQARTVRAVNVAADDPVRWMLGEPRGLQNTGSQDFLWLRLVDVEAALMARRYDSDGRVVLSISDPQLAENTGTFELVVSAGRGVCQRTHAAAQLSMDVRSLSAVYLSGATLGTLARAGWVRELVPGALQMGHSLFACDQAPWTVTDW